MTDCIHHWKIEAPSGTPTVKGRCKKCRRVRHFPTTDDASIWDGRGMSGFGQYARPRVVDPVGTVNTIDW